jgi:multiple sugar transport system ATP-binding protein
MASVTYDHVVKRYTADLTVVKDFNVEIKDKEFMVLVGPSGCGKSTALRMLAGLEAITEGEIRIGDRVVNNVAAKDRDIAMVFQSYALYPHMSVFDNMAFPLQMQHMKKDEIDKRVKNASRILGLDNFLKRKPRALSGGQRQRVALGRAIVRSPKVFLLDEPLSNLDAKLRSQMRVEIKRLRIRVPTTSVFVTHDQIEAMTLGDRVVVMKDGRIQQVGTPLEVYGNPANKFVAGFIGAPSMNFLDVTIREKAGKCRAENSSLNLPVPASRTAALSAWRDKKVILGMRPEHLVLGNAIPDSSFDAGVEVIEQLGAEIVIEVRTREEGLTVARIDPQTPLVSGDKVRLSVPPEQLHFFDPATELAIR